MISVCLLGAVEVSRDGVDIPLPRSRKTRALLAYLATTARAHQRDKLCELLWEVPDDPRGALRWSLSKLRGLAGEADKPFIRSDRLTAGIEPAALSIDLARVRSTVAGGIDRASTDA